MNKKLFLEFIPLTLFVIFGIFTFFKTPYAAIITSLSGMLLAMLYFYGAFWLFAETTAPIASRIVAGLAFSLTIISCIFCLLHWPYWKFNGVISYSVLGIMLIHLPYQVQVYSFQAVALPLSVVYCNPFFYLLL